MPLSLALTAWLALASATFSAPVPPAAQADWRRDGIDERVKLALTARGWRLEDDGRALDPKTKAPAAAADLDKAVLDLRGGARRAALEKVNLLLSSRKPLEEKDRNLVAALSADLPPALAAALLDPKSAPAELKAMAGTDLSLVAAYFDGSSTLADRRAAASPVPAASPGPRVALPYFDAREKAIGEKLRAAAAAEITRDPFGRTVLSRLNGRDGKPDLPPILIEDQGGSILARYDFRRKAVVLDAETLRTSIVEDEAPSRRLALRDTLSTRSSLLDAVAAHPELLVSFIRKNCVLLVHELTHAWQDRREPVLHGIAHGNLPDSQILEYEQEAYLTKNLYLHSKLKNDPASVSADGELDDYELMMHGPRSWWLQKKVDLIQSSPSYALALKDVADIQRARLATAKSRQARTREQQRDKSLDLAALTIGSKSLNNLRADTDARLDALYDDVKRLAPERHRALAAYYLGLARGPLNPVDRGVALRKAALHAQASHEAAP